MEESDMGQEGRREHDVVYWEHVGHGSASEKERIHAVAGLCRQGRPAEASGLRPSGLASRPPALEKRLRPCFFFIFFGIQLFPGGFYLLLYF